MIPRCHIALIAIAAVCGSASAQEPSPAADEIPIEKVDFERHIAPLLSRLGCNAGSCHGAADGKGGFKLSLFGHDAALDCNAITAADSERVNVAEPPASLLLQKPTLAIDHEGGLRLKPDSWEYALVARWITEGARHVAESGKVLHVAIEPNESVLSDESSSTQIRVFATYQNGDRAEVTRWSKLRVLDETIARLSDDGALQRVATGDTAVIATYNGASANCVVFSPRMEQTVAPLAVGSEHLIDHHVAEKLHRLHIEPTSTCSDSTFLRRVTLAAIGRLPAPDSVRQFLADSGEDKRDRLIDSLLGHPRHASMWATRMCEITGSGEFSEGEMNGQDHEVKWHAWFRARFADNVPYDAIVNNVLTGTSRDQQSVADFINESSQLAGDTQSSVESYAAHLSLDLFWQRPKLNEEIDVEAVSERVAAAFLGVRIECARCHQHPFDRWTQNDHRSFSNIFAQVRFGMSPDLRAGLAEALEQQRQQVQAGAEAKPIKRMREIYVATTVHDLRDPLSQAILPAQPLGGARFSSDGDRREVFAQWLTSADNPFFAKNFVNRVWAQYFGVGLVDPVDDFSVGNPPSHPQLLDALAKDFVEHDFDIRHLERLILTSQTWQRASDLNNSNVSDRRNYSRTAVRMLPAEVVVDGLSCAIGDREPTAVEVPGRNSGDEATDNYFKIFNRPQRRLTCDCERQAEPTLRQTMLLLSDPMLLQRINGGHVARLAASGADNNEVINELFLLAFSRLPDEMEIAAATAHIESAKDRQAALADVLWGLITTREFVTFH